MESFKATGALLRLALRRDRIKLPLWILGIAGAMAANVPAVTQFYGGYEKQLTYAATTATSIISRVFGGPLEGPELGEIVLNETFLFTALAIAFMSTLTIVRHTRQNEETGRSELIGSAVVGRHASLTAALLTAVLANVILAILLALIFALNDLSVVGSIGTGAVLGCIGIVFASVAAITAQVSDSARGANSTAAAVIGGFFLLRAIGDGIGKLVNNGMGVSSAWPSWLSPLGWGQQMHPFTKQKWWIFALYAAFFSAVIGVAYAFNARRDVGLGMIPARRGPASANPRLLSPLGLAWRLQHGTIRGWAIGVGIMGITIGLIAEEFEKLFDENQQIADFFAGIGGTGSFSDVLFSGMLSLMGVTIAAYVIQSLLRMRSEESTGRLEPVLGTSVSKPRWMLSHNICMLIGVLVLVVMLGLSTGITYVLATGAAWSEVPRLVAATSVHMPAILVIAGVVNLLFGLLPSLAIALSWGSFALCFVFIYFGDILKLPGWLLNISPFTHTPAAPLAPVTAKPLVILMIIFGGLLAFGLSTFRRRDIETS